MKSKFGFWGYFPIFIGIPLLLVMVGFVYMVVCNLFPYPPALKGLPLILLLTLCLIWLFWGECRTKMIVVNIDGDIVSVRRFGGLGRRRIYLLSEFDGFKTSRQQYGGRGMLEYLFLKKGDKKLVKISEAYHKNYQALKAVIASKTRDLGYERFSFLDEIKEILV